MILKIRSAPSVPGTLTSLPTWHLYGDDVRLSPDAGFANMMDMRGWAAGHGLLPNDFARILSRGTLAVDVWPVAPAVDPGSCPDDPTARAEALEAAVLVLKAAANDALAAWDNDRDSRVGKLLAAMAGRLKGYRADIDQALTPPASAIHQPLTHYGSKGQAECGADEPNMGLTTVPAHVTCRTCLGWLPIVAPREAVASVRLDGETHVVQPRQVGVMPLILRHEGCRLKPYVDTAGKITIGVGRNLTDRGITQDQADAWLDEDIADCVNALGTYPWFGSLNEVRQHVLIDLVFNVGAEGFTKFRRLRAALAAGNYDQAGDEIEDSMLAPHRRTELAQMMRMGATDPPADEGREP